LRILLTGKNGQVGWGLARALPALGEVIATDRSTLDLANVDQIRRVVREVKPDVIVNAAAYTAVDKAEAEPEMAMVINAKAPGVLAEEAKRIGALLVHYSTDYVFDGEKGEPYVEDDAANPVNVYGKSKLAGERAICVTGGAHIIVRTSWIYSDRGSNFLLTMLRLAAEHKELRVVDDQLGAPTSAHALAKATAELVSGSLQSGTFHMTATGATSWHGFAAEIMAQAEIESKVIAIRSAELRRPARRPRDSRLSNGKLGATYGLALADWRLGLRDCLAQMQKLSG
jgi:dTDP-4-dehydrorhamnose reductase